MNNTKILGFAKFTNPFTVYSYFSKSYAGVDESLDNIIVVMKFCTPQRSLLYESTFDTL